MKEKGGTKKKSMGNEWVGHVRMDRGEMRVQRVQRKE